MIGYYRLLFLLMSYPRNSANSAEKPDRFLLPKGQFEANDIELNSLKRRLLANSYNKQIHNKQQNTKRQSVDSNKKNSQNPQHNLYQNIGLADYDQAQIQRERYKKMKLAKQYEEHMSRKYSLEKLQRQRKVSQEKMMIQNLRTINQKQQQKQRRAHIIFRRQMTDQLQQSERNRINQRQQQNKQKQEIHKKYDQMIQRSISNGHNQKQNRFKQHYDEVNRVQNQIGSNYINKWSPMIKQREQQKDKLIEAGIYQTYNYDRTITEMNLQKQSKRRNELKLMLQRQIWEKQKEKKSQNIIRKQQQYSTYKNNNLHNPIYNPVDFRMAHDNKLVLQQLRHEREQGNRVSGLAKNGSQILIPYYPTQ